MKGPLRKRKKIQPMKYPAGIEYSYRVILNRLVNELRKQLKKTLAPRVPAMVREVSNIHYLPTGKVEQHSYKTVLKTDAWQDELNEALQQIEEDMVAPTNKAIRDMLSIGPKINQYNKEQWKQLIRSQYGVDPTKEDADRWDDILSQYAEVNAALIKDIPDLTMEQIQDETEEALRSGRSIDELSSDIFDIMEERTDVSESRANLIARDQVAKLNGQFTKERQSDLGVEQYTWRTVGDERVRETHRMVDGLTFTWGSPPDETDGNEPGQDYQCRCFAEPILPELAEFRASLLETEDA
jgi:SPP1 gp7 family putative phage head morphogenesis protein